MFVWYINNFDSGLSDLWEIESGSSEPLKPKHGLTYTLGLDTAIQNRTMGIMIVGGPIAEGGQYWLVNHCVIQVILIWLVMTSREIDQTNSIGPFTWN